MRQNVLFLMAIPLLLLLLRTGRACFVSSNLFLWRSQQPAFPLGFVSVTPA